MGVKKRVEAATERLTSRFKQSSVAKALSNPSSTSSLRSRGIEALYLLALFLLVSGVINAISNAGVAGINNSPIVSSGTVQNFAETIIIMFGYIVGTLGAYALYLSGRQTIRARSAEIFFVGGIGLVAIGVVMGYYLYYITTLV